MRKKNYRNIDFRTGNTYLNDTVAYIISNSRLFPDKSSLFLIEDSPTILAEGLISFRRPKVSRKIAGKGGVAEYLVLNVNLPGKHVKSNVESIGNITSFRTYDIYFHYDVRGHSARVMLPRRMRVALSIYFLRFSYRFFPLFLSLALLVFLYIAHLSHIFVLALLVH